MPTPKSSVPVATLVTALAFTGACASAPLPGQAPIARQDPGEQFVMMERMTTQIDRATRDVPAERYLRITRPRALAKLSEAGFSARDGAEVMARVDERRADRVRMAQLWRGDEPTAQARAEGSERR
jgi:hypothetical protein